MLTQMDQPIHILMKPPRQCTLNCLNILSCCFHLLPQPASNYTQFLKHKKTWCSHKSLNDHPLNSAHTAISTCNPHNNPSTSLICTHTHTFSILHNSRSISQPLSTHPLNPSHFAFKPSQQSPTEFCTYSHSHLQSSQQSLNLSQMHSHIHIQHPKPSQPLIQQSLNPSLISTQPARIRTASR